MFVVVKEICVFRWMENAGSLGEGKRMKRLGDVKSLAFAAAYVWVWRSSRYSAAVAEKTAVQRTRFDTTNEERVTLRPSQVN